MWRRSNQCAAITPGAGESANHCAQLISWSAMRSSGTRDSPSSTGRRVEPLQRRDEVAPAFAHRVEEHAVDAERRSTSSASASASLARLPPGADVPRVVVDEHAHAAPLELGHQLGEAGDVAVEVELVAVVEADDRIGVPQHDGVEAAEPLGVGEQPVGRELAAFVVEQPLVPQPHHAPW